MIEKNDTSKSINLSVSDITVDSNPVDLSSTPFMFGVLFDSDYDILSDGTYISMSITQHNYVGSVDKQTTFTLEKWSNTQLFTTKVK